MRKGIRSLLFVVLLVLVLLGWTATGQVRRALTAEAESEYRELQIFTDVLTLIRRSYVEEVDLKELIYGAIDGMVSTLDPHSAFMPPEMYREMKIDTRGEFGGLGIEITLQDGVLTVVSPIEDTPAFRAGLQAGDQIVKIEERFTKDLTVTEAVNLMRGPKGTEITLTVMRESFDKPKEFTLTREIIKIKSVKAKVLEPGYGYIRLTQFQERTAEDLQKAMKQLREENSEPVQGLILDLRNNPGGLLDQAVKVADLFLDEGLIVYTEGREEGSKMEFAAHQSGTEPSYPMVILINGGSASASEIVAGALKDHRRGIVLGTRSFGKGSVQTILPLSDDSALRLTTARYFTPNGISIQAKGITPDITVPQVEITDLKEGRAFREEDLENHFETPGKADANEPPREENGTPLKPEERNDYQLMRALDLLKGLHLFRELPAA